MIPPIEYLKQMAARGIGFYTQMPTGGMCDLDPDDVPIFMADENAYWARTYHVSVEQFVAWQTVVNEHPDGLQCEAVTSKKVQCKNYVPAPESPVYYNPRAPIRCDTHKGK